MTRSGNLRQPTWISSLVPKVPLMPVNLSGSEKININNATTWLNKLAQGKRASRATLGMRVKSIGWFSLKGIHKRIMSAWEVSSRSGKAPGSGRRDYMNVDSHYRLRYLYSLFLCTPFREPGCLFYLISQGGVPRSA